MSASESSESAEAPESSGPELGDLPTPTAEEPELHPGGPDAILDREPEPLVADLPPETNPAVDDAPAETREGEDTDTEATASPDGESRIDPAAESPA